MLVIDVLAHEARLAEELAWLGLGLGLGFGFGLGVGIGFGLGTPYEYSEVVPALGTPPMMKCGKQMYSWLKKRGRQRGSSRAFALPAEGGCCAPG